jgi:hypothetical protein
MTLKAGPKTFTTEDTEESGEWRVMSGEEKQIPRSGDSARNDRLALSFEI